MKKILRPHPFRTVIAWSGLLLLSIVLIYFALPLLPALWNWRPHDYTLYVKWGSDLRRGIVTYAYPLPTIVWVSVPLSLLPPQFAIVWAAAPFAFVLALLGRRGIPLWLYFPLLAQTGYAQLDGLLILPMAWVLANRARLAPLGAVLLMTKPTVAPFVIGYMLWHWIRYKQWQQLKWFGGILFVYLAPSFVIDPNWIPRFIAELPIRANEANMLPRGASLWAFVWRGGLTLWLLPIVIALIAAAVIYLARHSANFAPPMNVLNMFFVPPLYASTFTLLIPNLQTLRESVALVAFSWLAVLLDILVGGWGGVYAIIPAGALLLLIRRARSANPTPQPELRAKIQAQQK